MELFSKILIISHVVAGSLTLISGLAAAFIGKKGGKLHRQVGQVFYWSMTWIFISALLIISFVRFNFFLLIIAVFSYYMNFSGVRVLKLRHSLKPMWYDWAAAIITILFGLSLFGVGINIFATRGTGQMIAYLCLFFGFFTAQTGALNLRGLLKVNRQERMWWWFAHMNSMCGALISSITAFLVQNGEIFNMPNNYSWSLWVLPAFVGIPLMSFWANKYRKQFKLGKYAVSQN